MSDDKPVDDANISRPFRPLILLGELAAIFLPGLAGAALAEYWFGFDTRIWGAWIGAILGILIAASAARATGRQGNLNLWLIAMVVCIASSRSETGRSQSLDTEFGRFLGLAAVTTLIVLVSWASSKWQQNRTKK